MVPVEADDDDLVAAAVPATVLGEPGVSEGARSFERALELELEPLELAVMPVPGLIGLLLLPKRILRVPVVAALVPVLMVLGHARFLRT